MKAPDKIFRTTTYLDNDKGKVVWKETPVNGAENIEYILKNALLEWLRKEYETISWYHEKMKHVTVCVGDNSSSGKAEAYKKVIDKIESL